jgi:muramoyltetrapeptide carboxypeptidase
MHFPVGHIALNATLPLGAIAELDADSGTLRIVEDPVEVVRASGSK